MKRHLKKLGTGMLLLTLLLTPLTAFAKDVQVAIDGRYIDFDVKPQIINDRTMVPLRTIFEELGAEVDWDDSTKTVISMKEDITVTATIGSKQMFIDDEERTMDVAPIIIDGRTLVPARFVAEAFGCTVEWDAKRSTVYITSDAEPINYYFPDQD